MYSNAENAVCLENRIQYDSFFISHTAFQYALARKPRLMKPGEPVALRDFEGRTLTRRVVSVQGDVVLVCTDEEYTAAKREKRCPISVGFKMAYVVSNRGRSRVRKAALARSKVPRSTASS